MSRSARNRTTPDAASSPNALPAAQDYGMDLRDVAGRPQQVGLAGTGSRAANIHAPDRPTPAQHHTTPRPAPQVSGMPHLDAGHVRDAAALTQQAPPTCAKEANWLRRIIAAVSALAKGSYTNSP